MFADCWRRFQVLNQARTVTLPDGRQGASQDCRPTLGSVLGWQAAVLLAKQGRSFAYVTDTSLQRDLLDPLANHANFLVECRVMAVLSANGLLTQRDLTEMTQKIPAEVIRMEGINVLVKQSKRKWILRKSLILF